MTVVVPACVFIKFVIEVTCSRDGQMSICLPTIRLKSSMVKYENPTGFVIIVATDTLRDFRRTGSRFSGVGIGIHGTKRNFPRLFRESDLYHCAQAMHFPTTRSGSTRALFSRVSQNIRSMEVYPEPVCSVRVNKLLVRGGLADVVYSISSSKLARKRSIRRRFYMYELRCAWNWL